MKRIGFRIETVEWQFYGERRRWVYDLSSPDISEEAWDEGRVVASVDASGYFEKPDQFEPLPEGSWRPLPFRYFEPASDIPLGNFDIERLMADQGTRANPPGERKNRLITRVASAIGAWWRDSIPRDARKQNALFLRLLALTPLERRPEKPLDFRIDVYAPGEQVP